MLRGLRTEYYEKALAIHREIGYRLGEAAWLNNLGVIFMDDKKHRGALAFLVLAKDIRAGIKDPRLKTTESNLNKLKEKLGGKEFEKLTAEVEPAAGKIVQEILKVTPA